MTYVTDKVELHKDVCNMLNNIYQRKNQDYGDSFGKSFRKRGITSAMVRMEDKWNRLDNLTLNPDNIKVKEESIEDTILDLANYLIMTYIELKFADEKNSNELNSQSVDEYVKSKDDILRKAWIDNFAE